MEEYFLIDGAMVYGALTASQYFTAQPAKWFASLMPHTGLRLAGPILVSHALVKGESESDIMAEVQRIGNGFSQRLHLSIIQSTLSLEALADHLRQFVYFADSLGEPYGLRIADCRVLAGLQSVLLPAQWDALTAPMGRWAVHDRKGSIKPLVLNESRHASLDTPEALQLSESQLDQLMQQGEPDALLAWIDRPAGIEIGDETQKNYDMACSCLSHWRASGSTSRGALLAFTRRVFASGGAVLADPGQTRWALQQAMAAMP